MTDTLVSKVEAMREIAARLERTAEAVEAVKENHREALDEFFSEGKKLFELMREEGEQEVRQSLEEDYSPLPEAESATEFLLRLVAPDLDDKKQWKYKNTLLFLGQEHEKGSVKAFMKSHGGINGCAKAGSALRQSMRPTAASDTKAGKTSRAKGKSTGSNARLQGDRVVKKKKKRGVVGGRKAA